MFRRFGPLALLLSAAALALLSTCAAAAEPQIRDVRIGFAGHYKHGHWAEVKATVEAGSAALQGELEIESRDGDGVPVTFTASNPVDLAARESAELTALVKMGPPRSGLTFRVRDKEQAARSLDVPAAALAKGHASTSQVVLSVGAPAGVEEAAALLKRLQANDAAAVALSSAKDLPTQFRAYDAIDCLFIAASTTDPLSEINSEQRSALVKWLHFGGRLVYVAGEAARDTLSGSGAWSTVLPGRVRERVPLTTDASLRAITGEPLSFDAGESVILWDIEAPRRLVTLWDSSASSGDHPLIVEQALGLGRISLLLLDVTQPPLHEWPGRPRLLAYVISGDDLAADLPPAASSGGRMTHLGYRDLAGQLRAALDQYAGVSPVHFYTVAAALVVYLLILFPGEYLLLRKATPRSMQLTWFVFPLTVIAFTGGALWLGQASRGGGMQINQVELVDLDVRGGKQRGFLWLGIFSPEARSYKFEARPTLGIDQAQVERAELAWQALPGEGLGGVDGASRGAAFATPYHVRPGSQQSTAVLDGLAMAKATSKILSGQWWGDIPPSPEASDLRRGKLRELEGSFTNISPVPLRAAYLAHGEWLYRARGEIAPGAQIQVDQLERKHLEYHFTQRRVLESTDTVPWSQEEMDIPRILEIMMFHEAVRGRTYTVLTHRYQPELDLSHLITSGHAVLVGQAAAPLVDVQANGEPLDADNVQRWTYLRIVYPVAEEMTNDE